MDKLLTAKDVASILGLGKSIIYRLMSSGELPTVQITKGKRKSCWRVRIESLEKFLLDREIRTEDKLG